MSICHCNDYKILANADLARILIAGRRAAYGELHVIAADRGIVVNGDTEAEYGGEGPISINGVDLRPMIGAAIIETMVQMDYPSGILAESPTLTHPKRGRSNGRAWWRFWA